MLIRRRSFQFRRNSFIKRLIDGQPTQSGWCVCFGLHFKCLHRRWPSERFHEGRLRTGDIRVIPVFLHLGNRRFWSSVFWKGLHWKEMKQQKGDEEENAKNKIRDMDFFFGGGGGEVTTQNMCQQWNQQTNQQACLCVELKVNIFKSWPLAMHGVVWQLINHWAGHHYYKIHLLTLGEIFCPHICYSSFQDKLSWRRKQERRRREQKKKI